MNENDIKCPVFLISGFLDGGKTTFINSTIGEEYFAIDGITLLIVCEEGEIEYDGDFLSRHNTVMEVIESKDDFTYEHLKMLRRKYRPARVLIEYNGFWSVKELEEMRMPNGWGIVQRIVMTDAGTFLTYMRNMKSVFVEMVRKADMITFNRCTDGLPLANFRRSVKVVNPGCVILFEDMNGKVSDILDSALPFDIDADVIKIEDDDFGIFVVDARENPDRYRGKSVSIHGQVHKNDNLPADVFVPGRMAMTCCADDMQFIGFLCRSKQARRLEKGSWVNVTAEVRYEKAHEYRGETGPVLYATSISKAEPAEAEWVSFT